MKRWLMFTPYRSYGDMLFWASLVAGGIAIAVTGCALYAGYLMSRTGESGGSSHHVGQTALIFRKVAACRAEVLAYENFIESQRMRECKVERLRGLFDIVAESLPKGVWISTVETRDERIRITGYAFADHDISEFSEALRVKGFGERVLVEASRLASEEANAHREFVVTLRIPPREDCANNGAS